MRCLEERQEGFLVGITPAEVVPIVPGAAINDVGRIGSSAKPTADNGYQACMTAADGPVAQGNVGAATGAVAGGMKGGFGTASSNLGNGVWVGAAVVVGSYGRPWVPGTCALHFSRYTALGTEYGPYKTPTAPECASADGKLPVEVGNSVAVVATNFALSKAQAQKMAGIGQDGFARAIRPSHTSLDGDAVFALSTGTLEVVGDCQAQTPHLLPTVCAIVLNEIFAMAANTISRAVNHAVLKAKTVGTVKSYCDTFPTACSATSAQAEVIVSGISQEQWSPSESLWLGFVFVFSALITLGIRRKLRHITRQRSI
jgi:L-aminopeptidase/D-esterase-like protein